MGSDFPKPEIRTVAADKIFDTPGRSERPSHVSWCVYECVCVCVCMIIELFMAYMLGSV